MKPDTEGHRFLPPVVEDHVDLQDFSPQRVGTICYEVKGVAGQGALVGGQAQGDGSTSLRSLVDHRPGEVPGEPVLLQAAPLDAA
ncbi:MAG: hypothetical protein RMJ98_20800 [Myxococcales bacterium]|nr:hypothetical protein [Myxococcales bacterium]